MIRRSVRIQLVAFAMIAVLAIAYAAVRFGGVNKIFDPPYTVHVHFADAAGLAPKDEVDELGVNVGTVSALHPDGNSVIVDLSLNHGTKIPSDLHAAIADKSALGEQFVLLTPRDVASAPLHDGSTIDIANTSTPVALSELIGNVDALAKSIPKRAVRTDLAELSKAFTNTGPDLQRLLDSGTELTASALANLDRTISLINTSTTVLRTQVDETAATRQLSQQLADFTTEVRTIEPEIAQTFANGVRAGDQVTELLHDNEGVLPTLLNSLLTTTGITRDRLPQLRKTLTLYPWVLQIGASAVRYCDNYHLHSGKPVKSTCHYDPTTGQRIYTAHFAFQTPSSPDGPPYNPCTKGYGGTTHYLPNGQPASGRGKKETVNTKPNRRAHCKALPTDPNSPNVRGSQNVQLPPGDTTNQPGGTATVGRGHARAGSTRITSTPLAWLGQQLLTMLGVVSPSQASSTEHLMWLLFGATITRQ